MKAIQAFENGRCGCETSNGASPLISMDEALRRLGEHARPITGTETEALSLATGRVLADPVLAATMTPPFDSSAMDGYALDSAALWGEGPWRLPVTQRIPAGAESTGRVAGGTAAQIFTGAPVPLGADAVVPQEHVARDGNLVILDRRPQPGLNIRRAGGDMRPGQTVLEAGSRLGPREIAACAAAGAARVHLIRPVRVALLVTGSEVRPAGANRGAAEIWDINSPMLTSELSRPDIHFIDVMQGADDRTHLRRALADMAKTADLIVTTGGISVGEEDHVKPVLDGLEATAHFSGVAIKPRKPVSFGQIGTASWLGLPGNPLSALVIWHVFGLPLLDILSGRQIAVQRRRHVVAGKPIFRKPGRCEVRPARLMGFDSEGREIVDFGNTVNSAHVADLPGADGLIFIPAETDRLPEGALLEFQPFNRA